MPPQKVRYKFKSSGKWPGWSVSVLEGARSENHEVGLEKKHVRSGSMGVDKKCYLMSTREYLR